MLAMTPKLLLVLLLSLWGVKLPVADATARLLASKIILNDFVVEGKDLSVQYSIYNVGTSVAQNVTLSDDSFLEGEFELVHGLQVAVWERIPNKGNVSHTVIYRPLSSGVYNISWGKLVYQTGSEGGIQEGYTNAPRIVTVISNAEFSRRHASHITEWIAFFLMSAPTVVLPFLMWYSSHSKYEKLKNKKA